jgi:hypothetical protein
MGIKISQLPALAVGNIRANDTLPIVDSLTLGTKKVQIGDIKSYATAGLSGLAYSASYGDIQGLPSTFPVAIATINQLGGIKVGPHLTITQDGTLDMGPAFNTINVGNDQVLATTNVSSLNFLAGNNITLVADPVTNTITFNSSGGSGSGGSGNVGKGTTGTLAVYYNTTTVTATSITSDGSNLTMSGSISAAGLVTGYVTLTNLITLAGDLIVAPSGNMSLTGKRITNLAAPVGSGDAATKGYVDNASAKAFGKITIPGQGIISATSGTDSLNFVAGNNVTLSTNPGTKSVTIAVNNTLSFQLLPASTSSIGGVIVGTGLQIDQNGILSSQATALTTATTSTIGGVKIGAGLAIAGDGTLSSAAAFTLNTATTATVGGISIGYGLQIDQFGSVSVPSQVLTTATKFLVGGVKIGNSIAAAVDGTIDVNAANIPAATTSSNGVVRPGYGLSITPDGALSLGVNGNFTITGNLSVNGVISATNIFTTGTAVTIISSANDLQLRAVGQVITNTTLFVNSSTVATSTSTGALQVWGGVGIGKNIITGEPSTINGVLIGAGGSAQPYNIAIGAGALQNNSGAKYITAVGFNALINVNADQNTAYGFNAGTNLVSGSNNTLVGIGSGLGVVSGTYNSAFGHQTYVGIGASAYNTIIGGYANNQSAVAQSNNVYLGYNIQNGTIRPGSYNTVIGNNTLQATTGSYNTVIGYGAGSNLTTASYQVIIGGYNGSAIATLTNYVSLSDGAGNLRAQWDTQGRGTFYNTSTFYATQDAIDSTSSGAVIVAGGMGIAKSLWVGTNIYVDGSPVVTSANLGTPLTGLQAGTDTRVALVSAGVYNIWNTSTLQSIVSRGATSTTPIRITSLAGSTGTSTGALVVDGSIGVYGDVYVGGRIFAGADSTATAIGTNVGLFDRGRRVMTNAILIPNLGIDITTSSNTATVIAYDIKNTGVTSVVPGNDISLLTNGTASFIGTGTVTVNVTSNLDTVTRRGGDAGVPVRILQTSTVSTGTSSGGLVVLGGMGITGPVNIAGSLILNGATLSTGTVFNGGTITAPLFVNNATGSTSTNAGATGNGAVSVNGGLSVGQDINVAGKIFINGLQLSTATIFNGGVITNTLQVNNAQASGSTSSGAVTITNGGLGVGGRINATSFYITTATGATPVPVGYGPIVSVTLSVAQTAVASGVPTKITFQSKEYDTGGYFDSTSNFRYQPLVGGFYQVEVSMQPAPSGTGLVGVSIFKNAAAHKAGGKYANNAAGVIVKAGAIVQMNGSTDFIEAFGFQTTGAAMTLPVSSTATYFQATFLRGL